MAQQTYVTDSIVLALIYRKQAMNANMISLIKAYEFNRKIDEILDESNTEVPKGYYYSYEMPSLYFIANDGEESYAIIDPNADYIKERKKYLGIIPVDIVIASQKASALDIIGLELKDGHLSEKVEKKLTLK